MKFEEREILGILQEPNPYGLLVTWYPFKFGAQTVPKASQGRKSRISASTTSTYIPEKIPKLIKI